jgi:hypothetical protein
VHEETGAWWVRQELGLYCPPIDAVRWSESRR